MNEDKDMEVLDARIESAVTQLESMLGQLDASMNELESNIAEAKTMLRPVFESICAEKSQSGDLATAFPVVYAAFELLVEMQHREENEKHKAGWCNFLDEALGECIMLEDDRVHGTFQRITPL